MSREIIGLFKKFGGGLSFLCLIAGMTTPNMAGQSPKLGALEWSTSAPLPEPRAGYAAGVLDGKLVIAGGTYWEGSPGNWTKKRFSATTHAFDPVTQYWEKLPDLPIPLGYPASAALGNQLFVLGGYTGTGVNRRIFTLQEINGHYVWKTFGEMAIDRVFASAVTYGEDIYLVGGTTAFEALDVAGTCCTTRTATNSLWVFRPNRPKNKWEQLSPVPGDLSWSPAAAGAGREIWVIGGSFWADAGTPAKMSDKVLKYDIAANRWDTLPPLPKELVDLQPLTAVVVPGGILLVSGQKKVWRLQESDMTYIPETPMPEAVDVGQFFWLRGEIIGAGGESQIEGPRHRSPWTFVARITPAMPQP